VTAQARGWRGWPGVASLAVVLMLSGLVAANRAHAEEQAGEIANAPSQPRASYGSYTAACESLKVLVRRALGLCARSARWSRDSTDFLYHDKVLVEHTPDGKPYRWLWQRDAPERVPSLGMTLETVSDGCPGERSISEALAAAGWAEDGGFSSDGTDGTSWAYFCREALVAVEATWDGGDDSDTTYVPKPGFSLKLTCVPRPPGNPALQRARRIRH